MLCEQIWGKLPDFDLSGKTVEYVDIEWHEAFKKIHKKTTDHGTEIGNRHAPLFWGEDDTFITIYNEPMLIMLQKIHGVTAVKEVKKLDFDQRISASIHDHHHLCGFCPYLRKNGPTSFRGQAHSASYDFQETFYVRT